MASKVYVESLESRVLLSAAMAPLVASPTLVVQGQGLVIAKGDAVPSRQDFTDFGPMSTSGGAARRNFVIKNTGATPLNVSALRVAGLNPGDYTIVSAPITNIAPGSQAALVIRFSPLAAGASSAKVVIRSNDPSLPRSTFAIQGQGLTTTPLPGGLKYTTTVAGSGKAAAVGDLLKVDYTGLLLNGVVFDSSLKPGRRPLVFRIIGGTNPLKWEVIKGWDEGTQGMLPGEQRTLIIPASLAYGSAGSGSTVPANATLVFELTLLGYQPSLHVLGQNHKRIPSGSTRLSATLGTDFGTTTIGHSVTRNFVLQTDDPQNVITALSTINFTSQGGQFNWSVGAYDYALGGWPTRITYKAGKVGVVNTTVSIPSDALNYPVYTFAIHGRTTA